MVQVDEHTWDDYNQLDDVERFCDNYIATADVAPRAEVAGYRKQEWIRVDERLPSVSGYVLAYTTAKNYMVLPYSKKYKLFNARDDSTEDEAKGLSIRVSCWMPIPEPPKT